jgi:hypothetical protein
MNTQVRGLIDMALVEQYQQRARLGLYGMKGIS